MPCWPELFHVTRDDQWERNAESYQLFRQIWRQDKVTAAPRFRPELRDAEMWPQPLQQPIRIWHGSATSRDSVDLAAMATRFSPRTSPTPSSPTPSWSTTTASGGSITGTPPPVRSSAPAPPASRTRLGTSLHAARI